MPENILPEDRAQEEIPPLASLRGTKQSHDNTDSLAQVNNSVEAPQLDEETPDFYDPELLVKLYKREKGIPIEEETQLYSIGGKVFTMHIDNKKKKR